MLKIRQPIVPILATVACAVLFFFVSGAAFTPKLFGQQPQQQAALAAPANPSPFYVTTFIDLLPQNAPAGTALIKQYVLDTQKEPGSRSCIAVAQVSGRANHLLIIEEWQDEAAFHRHEAASHTRDYRAKMLPLIGAPFDEREYFVVK